MIYEIYQSREYKINDGFLGFDEIFSGVVEIFTEIVSQICPEYEFIADICFPVDSDFDLDFYHYLESDELPEIKIIDPESGEVLVINDQKVQGLLGIAVMLRFLNLFYYEGDVDFAWRVLIGIACELKIKTNGSYLDEFLIIRKKFSDAGKTGADSKHRLTRELKEWALKQAATMRGAHTGIARTLAQQVPQHLAEASKDPQRFIYDTLRQQNKPKN